jgi:hypothetical protein
VSPLRSLLRYYDKWWLFAFLLYLPSYLGGISISIEAHEDHHWHGWVSNTVPWILLSLAWVLIPAVARVMRGRHG